MSVLVRFSGLFVPEIASGEFYLFGNILKLRRLLEHWTRK